MRSCKPCRCLPYTLTGVVLVQKQLQAIELDYQADEDIEHALKAQSSSMHLDIEAAEKRAAALQVCPMPHLVAHAGRHRAR